MTISASTMPSEPHVIRKSRILPQQPAGCESAVPLSLLDATTAKFGLTSAIWLLGRPTVSLASNVADHLRVALSTTLESYPQWCGYLRAILALDDSTIPSETISFPPHAKRYGRTYVHYGTSTDPGVEFVEASSMATVDSLYTANSTEKRPIWKRQGQQQTLTQFVPSTEIVHALEPNEKGTDGLFKPIMAIQCTELACGGLVLAVKIAHPLADITALTRFVRDWASLCSRLDFYSYSSARRPDFTKPPPLLGFLPSYFPVAPPSLKPVFEPSRLDASATGEINAADADPAILKDALDLPLHRYDWWAPPGKPPAPFPQDLPMAGTPLPWAEWDTTAPVEQCTVHFSREQIDHLWQSAMQASVGLSPKLRISKHDALLAHIWSCVVRARGLQDDQGPVHCDLVLGTRPAFGLDDSFIGSPTVMLNIEMAASQAASLTALGTTAQRIRETLSTVNDPQRLAAHLHSIAYEKSPQRIWQGFLGQRHIMVTTWARAGIYDLDFGFGSHIRYVDGVVPSVDGCILIVDGPPIDSTLSKAGRGWTDNGVDATFPLRCEDMERLLQDSLLLPAL